VELAVEDGRENEVTNAAEARPGAGANVELLEVHRHVLGR
jgi:hypothetical protein